MEFDITYDSEDVILSGPITKREILIRLRYRNLLIPELLKPVESLELSDPLDVETISFYENIFDNDSFTDSSIEEIPEKCEKLVFDEKTSPGACTTPDANKSENVIVVSDGEDENYRCNDESLNDTLEEMEMLMKFGIDYMAQNCSIKSETTLRQNNQESVDQTYAFSNLEHEEIFDKDENIKHDNQDKFKTPSQLLSSSKLKSSEKEESLSNKKIKDAIDVHPYKETDNSNKENVSKTKCKTRAVLVKSTIAESNSKIRQLPSCSNVKFQVENIQSPIGLYIKNSPTVPLIRNVFPKTEKVLPTRMYQPASRNVLLLTEDEPRIPSNIRKLIKGPLTPEVIRHVRRIKTDTASISATNLTNISEISQTNEPSGLTEDISVLISKNATRSNALKD